MSSPSRDVSPQVYKQSVRSCRACHQRKIRCDRGMPCNNCSRYRIACVYPTKSSDVARKSPSLQTISSRLERLEVLLSRLTDSPQSSAGTTPVYSGSGSQPQIQIQARPSANVNTIGITNQQPSEKRPSKLTWELLLNDEPAVQAEDTSNIESLPQNGGNIIPTQSTGSEPADSHLQKSTKVHDAPRSQLGACLPSDLGSDVLDFYPDAQLALHLWNVYIKSVDPVLKLLHVPTVQSTVVATILNPRSAQSSTVALTFAIYYAATTALCHDDDHEPINLPCEKLALLSRYKLCLDRLLVVPDLMAHPELASLQALAIYATCLRANEVSRNVWVLNGLAIRLAQSVGMHRDGASLRLSPFETEMRLRLWWHLCILESRAPEDQGFQPTVDVTNRELRLPLNVNDNQIYPDMTQFPTESDGWTEMSFFLIQTESCRLLHPVLDTQGQHSPDAFLDITEKRKIIQQRRQYLAAKCSGTRTHLSRLAVQHGTTAYRKMEFVLQLREEISLRKQNRPQEDPTPDVLKPSFKLACEGLESNQVLSNGAFGSRFKWFFNIYTPWYAIAYVLRCLCHSPYGFETERALALVEEVFSRAMSLHVGHAAGVVGDYGHDSLWRYINLLRHRALSSRHRRLPPPVEPTDDGRVPSSITGRDRTKTSQLLSDIDMPDTTTTTDGETPFPNTGQEYIPDSSQIIFSPLDLSMPEIPFLPDWNAVINGCLNDDVYDTNPSFLDNFPDDSTQFRN